MYMHCAFFLCFDFILFNRKVILNLLNSIILGCFFYRYFNIIKKTAHSSSKELEAVSFIF